MTIPGVDMMVARAMAAAIGKVTRFDEPQKLVSYLGLNPSVRQSGPGPAYHGPITKQGLRPCAQHAGRGGLGCSPSTGSPPGHLPSGQSSSRSARRGRRDRAQVAIIIWHLLTTGESYAWARPSLNAKKLRDLKLKAG